MIKAGPDGHSYRLGLVIWGYQARVPVGTDICHCSCAYTVLQAVQRHGMYSAVYGTVHYKEPLKSFEIRTGHSPGFGLPSVAILPWLCWRRRKAIFIYIIVLKCLYTVNGLKYSMNNRHLVTEADSEFWRGGGSWLNLPITIMLMMLTVLFQVMYGLSTTAWQHLWTTAKTKSMGWLAYSFLQLWPALACLWQVI